MNGMNNSNYRLVEIENEIAKAESTKKTAIILMIISLFLLWPLLIVGLIMYFNANSKINNLNAEKNRILYMENNL